MTSLRDWAFVFGSLKSRDWVSSLRLIVGSMFWTRFRRQTPMFSSGRCLVMKPSLELLIVDRTGESWWRHRRAVQHCMMQPRAAAIYLPTQNSVADQLLDFIAQCGTDDDSIELEDLLGVLIKYTTEGTVTRVVYYPSIGSLEPKLVIAIATECPGTSWRHRQSNLCRQFWKLVRMNGCNVFVWNIICCVIEWLLVQYLQSVLNSVMCQLLELNNKVEVL